MKFPLPSLPLIIISLFFIIGGIAHFVSLDSFIKIMPDYLGYHKELVIISGIFELLGAIGILIPRTRKYAGMGLILLSIAVFPANINMALHADKFPDISQALLYTRLPLQLVIIVFIWWAIKPKN
jgi:uncharacterized membrane protein